MKRIIPHYPQNKLTEEANAKWYASASLSMLDSMATKVFNKWIRDRDEGKLCISCNVSKYHSTCGHYYSASEYPQLRFHTDNAHRQCKTCNLYLKGNLTEYTKNIQHRISYERLKVLELLAQLKGFTYRDRGSLIQIIERFK